MIKAINLIMKNYYNRIVTCKITYKNHNILILIQF